MESNDVFLARLTFVPPTWLFCLAGRIQENVVVVRGDRNLTGSQSMPSRHIMFFDVCESREAMENPGRPRSVEVQSLRYPILSAIHYKGGIS